MPIEVFRTETEWSITLSGAIDIFEAQTLHATALEAASQAPAVTVRLDAVRSVDASSTQVLIALTRALAASGRLARLEGVPPAVETGWRLAGLDLQGDQPAAVS